MAADVMATLPVTGISADAVAARAAPRFTITDADNDDESCREKQKY